MADCPGSFAYVVVFSDDSCDFVFSAVPHVGDGGAGEEAVRDGGYFSLAASAAVMGGGLGGCVVSVRLVEQIYEHGKFEGGRFSPERVYEVKGLSAVNAHQLAPSWARGPFID
jgi:hypothetical protein